MKNMKIILILAIAINIQFLNASDSKSQTYLSNCESLQTAFTIAIEAHKQGYDGIQTIAMVTPDFTQQQLVICRKNYESQHPGVFQTTPAFIRGNRDGLILIDIYSREKADKINK